MCRLCDAVSTQTDTGAAVVCCVHVHWMSRESRVSDVWAGDTLGEPRNLPPSKSALITNTNPSNPPGFILSLASTCISSRFCFFQELEEVYSDLCATLSESVLQGAEIIASRVSRFCALWNSVLFCKDVRQLVN